jgi:hypothetical protein
MERTRSETLKPILHGAGCVARLFHPHPAHTNSTQCHTGPHATHTISLQIEGTGWFSWRGNRSNGRASGADNVDLGLRREAEWQNSELRLLCVGAMAWQYPHGHAYDLFVSCSTRDLGWVQAFHDDLVADINPFADFDVFPFLDKARLQRRTDRGVRPGWSQCRREVSRRGLRDVAGESGRHHA